MRHSIPLALVATLLTCTLVNAKPAEKKKEPTPDVALYNEGVDLLSKRKYARAQEKFEEAIKINAKLAEAHSNLGYVLRKQDDKNYDKALQHYNTAIRLNKKLAPAYAYRGALHVLMGDKAKAESDYEELLALDKDAARELRRMIDTGRESSAKEKKGIAGEHGW